MSKYLHNYNKGRCKSCGMTACYETDEKGDTIFDGADRKIKKGDLLTCASCKSVQYCCRKHQVRRLPLLLRIQYRLSFIEYSTDRH